MNIPTIDGTDWHVNLEQRNRHLRQGMRCS
jgi:hypothetical protein